MFKLFKKKEKPKKKKVNKKYLFALGLLSLLTPLIFIAKFFLKRDKKKLN